MSSHPFTYYAATLGSSVTFSALTENIEIETCIIGAGYAGLSTALGLVERGHTDVVLIDAQDIGFGCSGRNGGFVFGGFSRSEADLVKAVGPEKARDLYGLTTQGIQLIRDRISTYNIDCDAVWDGVMQCNWFEDENILKDHQAFMSDTFNVELDYIAPDALREIVKTDRYHGALVEKNAFHFHPLKYALGLAKAAQKQGAKFFSNSPALKIEPDGPVKIVHTPNGTIRAKRLLIACGGYLNGLYRPLARATLPVSTYIMVTEPLGERRNDAFTCQYAIYDTRFAFDYYRPLPDGRILWGGRISTSLEEPKNLRELLYRDVLKVYPQLDGVKIDYAWHGWMGYSAHKMPQIGEERPGVWHAQAFGGHGVAPTNIAGDLLAAAIAEGDQRYRKLSDPFGLTSTYGLFGKLGAEATYQYYMLRDHMRE